MSKRKQAADLPMARRPIDDVIAAARGLGRSAFTKRETLELVMTDARFLLMANFLPDGAGISDDEFDAKMRAACAAFDEGIDDYLTACESGKAVVADPVVSALEREIQDEQFQTECAAEILHWCAGIFEAIDKAARELPRGRSRNLLTQLAGCGNYVANDRAEVLGYVDEKDMKAPHD